MDNMRAGLGLQHIGIIMDGNGRWAKKRGLPRKYGHREGAKAFRRIRISKACLYQIDS